MQTVKTTKKEGYAIVQLNRGKVNAINHQMVNEIRETIKSLEGDDTINGVILTGIPNFFSAGLDVIELYDYDESKMREFAIAFGMMHVELVRFTKPMVCAINGHSPAGGTVIALAADYRIMAEGEKYTIGLNEVAVNIQISQNLVEAYGFWIGKSLAHRYALEGKLLNGKEAVSCGLVNELVPAEALLPKAEEKIQQYIAAHPQIIRKTKSKLRKAWLDNVNDNSVEELEEFLSLWWDPVVRGRMKVFVDRLAGRGA